MQFEKINNYPIFFIVGMGRSGTTLLSTILNTHPNSVLPFESRFIIYLKNKYKNCDHWTENKIDEFLDDLYSDRKFALTWNIEREFLSNEIKNIPQERITFRILCKLIYLSFNSIFNKEKPLIIGDKNPSYSFFIEEIIEVFPDAKFIHIVRDYRDVIFSFKKNFRTNNVALLAHRWVFYNHQIEAMNKNTDNKFYQIRYEDLVTESESNIRKICTFLKIDFYPEMLNFHKETKKAYDAVDDIEAIENLFPDLMKPIHAKNIGKWKGNLSEKELNVIEFVISKSKKKYGYPKNKINYSPILNVYSALGFVIHISVIKITKGYYFLPFSLRRILRKITDLLSRRYNIITFYNEDEVNISAKN